MVNAAMRPAVLGLAATACAAPAIEAEPHPATTDSGTTAVETTTAQTGDADGATSSVDAASSGSDDSAPGACAQYGAVLPEDALVAFELTSRASELLYFDQGIACGPTPDFELRGPDGAPLVWQPSLSGERTCASMAQRESCGVTATGCAPPDAGVLTNVATNYARWSGLRLTETMMDPACLDDEECGQYPCYHAEPALPGVYTLAITLYRECSGDCDCEILPNTDCPLLDVVLSDPFELVTSFEFPGAEVVQIVAP